MKILIAYDGSMLADAAIDDLRRGGLADSGVEAMVLTVADVWPALPPEAYQSEPASSSQIVRNAHKLARQALEEAARFAAAGADRIRKIFPQWNVRHAFSGGSPAGQIIVEAEKWRADLIVIGAVGQSALARTLLGSVSRDVVRHAHCSVRIGRASARTSPQHAPVHILIGIDGSPGAATAVSAVASRHWPSNSTACVVTALDVRITTALAFATPDEPIAPIPAITQASDSDWARDAVEAVARELREARLNATALVRSGDPREVLLDEAQKCSADCIFVGAKGLSRVERFLLGSVAEHVARRATCSVEVVRFPAS